MDSQEQIRSNRDRIRNKMKKMLSIDYTKDIPLIPEEKIFKEKQKEILVPKMRRKTSADVRQLGNCWDMFQFSQIVVSTCFENFYDLGQKIDQGAHSVVFICHDRQTKEKFAAKVIKIKDFDMIFNLKQSFRILKNLSHPNIIQAHNLYINENRGLSHIVCEHFQAQNLRIHLSKNRVIKETEAAEILNLLLKALVYIHSKGICHRDIKPENILYDSGKGSLKLIDFQIAKMVKYEHQKLQMWTNTGTIPYKAPQMFLGGYTESIDIWAVGVIAYELVTGMHPFRHLYCSELKKKICQSEPNYDKPNVTNYCIQFIKKCLKKNYLERFTANQALQSPFILKYSSVSSSCESPRFRKNGSLDKKKENFEIECIRCFNEDSKLHNGISLQNDGGIRVVIPHQK